MTMVSPAESRGPVENRPSETSSPQQENYHTSIATLAAGLGGLIVPVFAQNGTAGSEDQGTSMGHIAADVKRFVIKSKRTRFSVHTHR